MTLDPSFFGKRRRSAVAAPPAKASVISEPGPLGGQVLMPGGGMMDLSAFFPGGGGFTAGGQSPDRGFIVFPEMDTRREITPMSRTEMSRKSRALYDNVPFAKRVTLCISRQMGSLVPSPMSNDAEWKRRALARWRDLTSSPLLYDVGGKFNFSTYQNLISRRWLIDGDFLTAWAEGETGQTIRAPYESHRIGNHLINLRRGKMEDPGWYDGVKTNSNGRHQAYRLLDMDDRTKYTDISASQALLSAFWERAGQVRGVTPFHAAINKIVDTSELSADMMLSIKNSNLFGMYLSAPQSGTPMLGDRGLAAGLKKHLADREGNVTEDEASAEALFKIEEILRGGAIPEFSGFEPKILTDDNPHPHQMALLTWFVRECCLAFDWPPEAIWEMGKLNGNTSRLMKEDVQEVLEFYRKNILAPYCQRDWFETMGPEVASDLGEPDDGNWYGVDWISPRKKTIDRGAEGRLNMEERRCMLRTLESHYGEQQKGWEPEVDQWLDEIIHTLNRAEEKGFSEPMLASLSQMLLSPPQGAAAPSVDPDSDPPKKARGEDEEVDEDEE